jgi:hypothetical protein
LDLRTVKREEQKSKRNKQIEEEKNRERNEEQIGLKKVFFKSKKNMSEDGKESIWTI